MQTVSDEEQEKYKISVGQFNVLSENHKPQHNRTILSFQHYKLIGQSKMLKNGWAASELRQMNVENKEKDRRPQFINGISNNDIMMEII